MQKRRMEAFQFDSSVVLFGGAKLGQVSQEEADRSITFALENGINHFDTAASYGHAEERMGPLMKKHRSGIFLATKTGQRTKEEAKKEIYRSLERLQVDFVDLLQLHAIGDLTELDKALGKGGAIEAALEAKEEGVVKAIGITGHGHQAPATHLEALRRYPFETVLTPLNYRLYSMPAYREAFDALLAETTSRKVPLRVIKAIAKRPWDSGEERNYATWYKPWDEQKVIDACVQFVLSFEGIAGFASAGDVHLLPKIVSAVDRLGELSQEDAETILREAHDYESPFGAPTSIG
ncbi:aldo/keto reductase [Paenibacillus filicis]|uniref:Aldo/keto reductase n=1 Tax=Paenibacillus gyeongsangnamensis TaxID=3388067 RepID=A0ABT4QGK7_9BACL|nr:aldo/keto reductase [Paenibacillus filicis]MCZ8516015.1 aldo/keto reductase [Paenibacillus filicis]